MGARRIAGAAEVIPHAVTSAGNPAIAPASVGMSEPIAAICISADLPHDSGDTSLDGFELEGG